MSDPPAGSYFGAAEPEGAAESRQGSFVPVPCLCFSCRSCLCFSCRSCRSFLINPRSKPSSVPTPPQSKIPIKMFAGRAGRCRLVSVVSSLLHSSLLVSRHCCPGLSHVSCISCLSLLSPPLHSPRLMSLSSLAPTPLSSSRVSQQTSIRTVSCPRPSAPRPRSFSHEYGLLSRRRERLPLNGETAYADTAAAFAALPPAEQTRPA